MIASVAFRNFKALRNTSLKLVPFNLVIGPNGSGKTSLIQSLLRLRTLAKLPPGEAHREKTGGPQIDFHFSAPHQAITARMGCVSEFVCDLLQVKPPDAPGWPALRDELAHIRSYLLDHYAMTEPTPRKPGTELVSNGANLAAVLDELRTREPKVFAELSAEVVRILPEFSAVEVVEQGGNVSLALRLREENTVVSADNLSQGVLYLLAVLALSFDPAPPAILCIEEIDRGLHPRMLREVRDALYRLSHPESAGLKRRPVQVIATTHSPYLLDLFRDHPDEVVIAHKRGREARFERLADRADVGELLREGSLGDMWFSGILGGVPEDE